MVKLKEAELKALAVHKVGNKMRNEGYIASESLFELTEEMRALLQDYFLPPFRAEEFFKFSHETDLSFNEINTYCKAIFEAVGTGALLEQSIHILKHLYSTSIHPHIKPGEVYVAYFKGCEIDDTELDAIGIFKSENKDTFLKFGEKEGGIDMQAELGVNIKKLDKGCLIFNTFTDDGFSIMMVDRNSEDTLYWREDFLQATRLQDNSYQTENFLNLTKDFCEDIFAESHDKHEQLVLMNKAINYFSANDNFELNDFQQNVFHKAEDSVQFDNYRSVYEGEQGLDSSEGFQISKYTVRSMKKDFKNHIKLDTDIEIRINNKDAEEAAFFLERGFDEQRGMYFYKVFFNQEEA